MAARIRARLANERGDALISGLLTLGLILLVVGLAIQALAYAHARNVAQAAAQEGAETAATQGQGAGVARAQTILAAAGGTGQGLHPTAQANATHITVVVTGQVPHVFPGIALLLPAITARASVPTERYPSDETRR